MFYLPRMCLHTFKLCFVLSLFVLSSSMWAVAAADDSGENGKKKGVYLPYRLSDIDANGTTVDSKFLKQRDFERLNHIPEGSLGSFFSWSDGLYYIHPDAGVTGTAELYSFHREFNPDPAHYPSGKFDEVKLAMYYRPYSTVVDTGRQTFYSAYYKSKVRWYAAAFFPLCQVADGSYIYTNKDPSLVRGDLSVRLLENEPNQTQRLKQKSYYVGTGYSPSYLRTNICAGQTAHPLGNIKFKLRRSAISVPNVLAHFNFDDTSCDTSGKYCGEFYFSDYGKDRFDSDKSALIFNSSKNSTFVLPQNLLNALSKRNKFVIGFWAKIPKASTLKDGNLRSIFFGINRQEEKGEYLMPVGLSIETSKMDKEVHYAINRSFLNMKSKERIERIGNFGDNSIVKPFVSGDNSIVKPFVSRADFDWKFSLPTPFVISKDSSSWVYFVMAYDEGRAEVYMYNPKDIGGDWTVRYFKKQYILMNNDLAGDLMKWGFGVPGADVTLHDKYLTILGIDGVTVLNHGTMRNKEQQVRALFNEAILGNNPGSPN